jgi:enterochelin esterase family protein
MHPFLFVVPALLPLSALVSEPARRFASLADLDSEVAAVERGADRAAFWARVTASGPMPLVFGQTAVFFWRGEATTVEWRGDLVGWDPSAAAKGRRLGATDIWTWRHDLLPRSRADYKLVVDGATWLLDPANPQRQVGGYGPNSEIRMPGWEEPANARRRTGVARGTLGGDEPIASTNLGYTVNVRVYLPAGFRAGARARLPVLYLTDGSDYWNDEMGSVVATLDNLIADKKIPPVLAVFIDPWDRVANVNRRQKELVPTAAGGCPFCDFVAAELVPMIDARYPTRASPRHRAILGTSLGGLNATFMALRHPETFGSAGIQSPALGYAPWVLAELERSAVRPERAVIDVGLYEAWCLPDARRLRDTLERRGTKVLYIEVPDGHSWGHWRATVDDALTFLFGQ